MKKLVLLSAIAMSGLLYNTADAQIGLHIGIRLFPHRVIVAPGPVVVQAPVYREPVVNNYNNYDDFYYLPDVGAYYSVDEQLYYYQDGDQWIATAYLPGVYRDFDWRYARRIEVREARPFLHNDFYRDKYQGYDCDLVRNHDHFRRGFDFNRNRDAYNRQQPMIDPGFEHRFDNDRGGNDQHFDNRNGNDHHFDNRGNNNRGQAGYNDRDSHDRQQRGQQFDQKRNRGNQDDQRSDQDAKQDRGQKSKQDRLAQNDKGYDGHPDDRARRN